MDSQQCIAPRTRMITLDVFEGNDKLYPACHQMAAL